jgi:hypothetical protein
METGTIVNPGLLSVYAVGTFLFSGEVANASVTA